MLPRNYLQKYELLARIPHYMNKCRYQNCFIKKSPKKVAMNVFWYLLLLLVVSMGVN